MNQLWENLSDNITNEKQSSKARVIMETEFWNVITDDILMEQAKGMKLFILEKLLQDDSREKGMRYVYIYADTGCCEVIWLQVIYFHI